MGRACLVACLAALACSRPSPPAGYTLRIGVAATLDEVTPYPSTPGNFLATDLVYEQLLQPQGDGFRSRFLARWEPLDERRWRLEPSGGATFSDGSPVEPGDLAASLRAAGFEASGRGGALEAVAPPGATGPAALLGVVVFKKSATGILGTGPFAVAAADARRIALRRRHAMAGRIETVELVAFASSREVFARLLRREVNAQSTVDHAEAELLEGVPGMQLVRQAAPNGLVVRLNPRLSAAERSLLAAALPFDELAAAAGGGCRAGPVGPRGALPAGAVLRIGYHHFLPEVKRAALALRRALGPRGGDLLPVEPGPAEAGAIAGLDLFMTTALVWPPAMLAEASSLAAARTAFALAAPSTAAAARRRARNAGDDAGEGPVLIVVCRRERLMSVDARLRQVSLGDWGLLDTLPEWEVSP